MEEQPTVPLKTTHSAEILTRNAEWARAINETINDSDLRFRYDKETKKLIQKQNENGDIKVLVDTLDIGGLTAATFIMALTIQKDDGPPKAGVDPWSTGTRFTSPAVAFRTKDFILAKDKELKPPAAWFSKFVATVESKNWNLLTASTPDGKDFMDIVGVDGKIHATVKDEAGAPVVALDAKIDKLATKEEFEKKIESMTRQILLDQEFKLSGRLGFIASSIAEQGTRTAEVAQMMRDYDPSQIITQQGQEEYRRRQITELMADRGELVKFLDRFAPNERQAVKAEIIAYLRDAPRGITPQALNEGIAKIVQRLSSGVRQPPKTRSKKSIIREAIENATRLGY